MGFEIGLSFIGDELDLSLRLGGVESPADRTASGVLSNWAGMLSSLRLRRRLAMAGIVLGGNGNGVQAGEVSNTREETGGRC